MQHHAVQAELFAYLQVLRKTLHRCAVDIAGDALGRRTGGHFFVQCTQVHEVQAVAYHRPDARSGRLLAERGDLLGLVVDGLPGARVVGEHLNAVAAKGLAPVNRVTDAPAAGDVCAESHVVHPMQMGRGVAGVPLSFRPCQTPDPT